MSRSVDLLVLAKEPVAGRVKTRLCPPCSPTEAAAVAEAALADTLAAAVATGADRVVVSLDGDLVTRPGPRMVDALERVSQVLSAWRERHPPAAGERKESRR